jgi:hypothetical protein
MPTQTVTYSQFGGLNLRDTPVSVGLGGAVDLKNVYVNRDGHLATRDGYSAVYTAPTQITNMHPFRWGGGSSAIMVAVNGNSVKLVTVGGIASATTALTSKTSSFAGAGQFGSIYFTDGTSTQIRRITTTTGTISSPAGLATIKGNFVANTPWDDRLVVADATDLSMVRFSNAGDPETFGANNFVRLTPGDSKPITGMGTFRDRLFVFKSTRFFVFTSTSTDSAGNPVFNYYTVDTGIGCHQFDNFFDRLTATHPSGVYFAATDGIYVTTGSDPVRVSDAIAPMFLGAGLDVPSSFGLGGSASEAWQSIAIASDRLYATPSNGVNETFVLDIKTGAWTVFDWGASAVLGGGADESDAVFFGNGANLRRSDPTLTTDAGSAISWNYTSGLYSPANDPGRIAISLESQLVGSGTVTLQVATTGGAGSSSGALDTGSAVTLGTAPAIAEGWQQVDREGKYWSHKLSGSGSAVVAELSHFLSYVKPAGAW